MLMIDVLHCGLANNSVLGWLLRLLLENIERTYAMVFDGRCWRVLDKFCVIWGECWCVLDNIVVENGSRVENGGV